MKKKNALGHILPKDPFAYIGLWQFLTFILLLLIIWYNELADLPAFFFKTPPEKFNAIRGCVLSAAVLITAIVAIGNTYLQQKHVAYNLISICSGCHRVQINEDSWEKIEDYISDNTLLTFTHGLCPACKKEMMESINKVADAKKTENNTQAET